MNRKEKQRAMAKYINAEIEIINIASQDMGQFSSWCVLARGVSELGDGGYVCNDDLDECDLFEID